MKLSFSYELHGHIFFHVILIEYSLWKNLYGVSFKVKEATLTKYKLFGINLEEANGNDDNVLPVPATFIINQNRQIEYIHFDENYKDRLSVSEIIKHL